MARVFVGLSGGVDSALACALLLEEGHDVTAVYMRNWSRDLPGYRCPWAEDLAWAERVAFVLGCDLKVWDFEEEYKRTVVDYLVDAYAKGYTPNPDVMCNQTIKFGTFLERALEQGADLVATGHYARLETKDDGLVSLKRARDEHKDQTYFLWRLGQEALFRTLFPIGDIRDKTEVRCMCAERGLGVQNKPDSDGICFVGPVGIRSFLMDTLEPRAGEVVEWETGKILGTHDGAFLFTIGQRRGLDLGGGPARYVVSTDTVSNVVYVTSDLGCPALWTRELSLENTCWISGEAPVRGRYFVRCRHTGELREAEVATDEDAHATIRFDTLVRTVAPGQSVVVYEGTRCLGGGFVDKRNVPTRI